MPTTAIHELKIMKKGSNWSCRFETTLDDGRIKRIRIPVDEADITLYEGGNSAALDSYIADAQARVIARVKDQDANNNISPDVAVAAETEATIQDRAVAYLRKAWREENAYDGYLLFDRFNDYRQSQGWTLDQVQANLASAGLTDEEWTSMRSAYEYLNGGKRPNTMSSYQTIQANWENR